MKRVWMLTLGLAILLSANAQATLTTIGTASYLGNNYKLIYMDDGPFGPITWLDYTNWNHGDTWQDQVDWATGIGAELTVTLYDGYATDIDWSTGWRLPETDESQANLGAGIGYEGPDENGYHDYDWGYNMVNSEMGVLFYEELGNKALRDEDGNLQAGYGLINTPDFENLQAVLYFSGTVYSPYPEDAAWYFVFEGGRQYHGDQSDDRYNYGLAVHSGEVSVSDVSAVPEPCSLLLLGTGLLGLAAVRRKKKS